MTESLIAQPLSAPVDGSWTYREIFQQPATLLETQHGLAADQARINAFLAPLLALPDLRVVLTGAGTSAFIGESLAPWLSRSLRRSVEAISTTDIVSAPDLMLRADEPTLLVSFGRSGSSPESKAAVELADARVASVYHLIITCNPAGDLAGAHGDNTCVVVLPEETHDRGFAMTSSFTAMTYAALAIFTGVATMARRIERITAGVTDMLARSEGDVGLLAGRGFERVVYLGSGVFKGLSREAALKLMELSDGAIVTAFDTPMGFRHGPKTIVTAETLVVVFVSNDPLTRRYDLDIVEELRGDGRAGAVLAVAARPVDGRSIVVQGMDDADDVDLLFAYVVPAQLFALKVSLALGLTPDRPNASGMVNRVVQGVRIHALNA